MGHILFSHPGGQKSTLIPPMKGHGPYSKILNWVKSENVRSEFVPCVPPPLVTPSQHEFKNFHRLTYRSSATLLSPPSFPRVLKLEIPLEPRDVDADTEVIGIDMKHVLKASGTPQMWTGYQSVVDMLIPHRSAGVRTTLYPSTDCFVGQLISGSLPRISPSLQPQPSLSFSGNMLPNWMPSKCIAMNHI